MLQAGGRAAWSTASTGRPASVPQWRASDPRLAVHQKQLEALEEDITQLFASTHRRIEEEQEMAADEEEEWGDDDDDDEMYANLGVEATGKKEEKKKKKKSRPDRWEKRRRERPHRK